MRRACSSDVRSVSFLGRAGQDRPCLRSSSVAAARRISGVAVEPEPVDLGGDRRQGRGRRSGAPRRPVRGSPRTRRACGVIGNSSTRSGRDSERDHPLELARVDARPRRRAEPRELEHALGARPRRERRELVGADQEDGVVEARAPRASRPCGQTGRARPRPRRAPAKASSASASLVAGGGRRPPCGPGRRRRGRAGARGRSARSPRARARRARCAAGRRRRRGSRRARSLPDR